jgi:hypothetical protein
MKPMLITTLFLSLLLFAAKPPLDVVGTVWDLPVTQWKGKAKVKSVGSVKDVTFEPLSVLLGEDGQWEGLIDGEQSVYGTWERKSPNSNTLVCTLDADSMSDLAKRQAHEIESEASLHGIDAEVTLVMDADASSIRLRVRSHKGGTATLKLRVRLRYTGTTSVAGGPSNAPTKVSVRVKGVSLEQKL